MIIVLPISSISSFSLKNLKSARCPRHTFATMMHDLGASMMTIKDVIGHEDIKSTQQYIGPDSKSKLLDFQERLLSSK
ncbi:tyrosine-type recombinase/integrase [Pedobacter sp. GR22-6]|uniref:tyrosine-type recombinase/integrase n=1 Tax=Pedobacter sp. GR22-6 TaxID=3127957 RepID=UPI003FCE6FBD